MAAPVDLHTSLGAAPVQRDVVRVHGPEAVEFLQGQLSQDVAGLAVGESAPALLLQPNGKVVAWLRATRLGADEVLLDVQAGFGPIVHERLRRFKLRTKAEFESPAPRWGLAMRGPGADEVAEPAGTLAVPARWPGVSGVDLIGDGEIALAGVPLVSAAALEALRVECGVPAMGAELTDSTIPAEAGQWLIDASVDFTKGCYTGQELVARIDSRGNNVPRNLRTVVLDGTGPDTLPPTGAEVVVDGAAVGALTSVVWSPSRGAGLALAYIGRAVAPPAEATVRWAAGEVPARVEELTPAS